MSRFTHTLVLVFCFVASTHWAYAAPVPELDDVQQILREMLLPPNPWTTQQGARLVAPKLSVNTLETLPVNVLADYKVGPRESKLHQFTLQAQKKTVTALDYVTFKETIHAQDELATFRESILTQQKAIARSLGVLAALALEFRETETLRANEPCKRWQAHYDYLQARTMLQMAFLFEYSSALAQLRREDLPALEPGQNGWRLVPREEMVGDRSGKTIAKEAKIALEQIEKTHANTPWAELAKQARLAPLGMTWEPTKLVK